MCKKKHILIIAPYITFPNEPGANRFIAVAKKLSQKYSVTLVTSKFCHILKSIRAQNPYMQEFKVILIDEPGYQKNVSLKRLLSHHIFCKKFEQFLASYNEPIDLVYSAYPLIKTNYILGKYKKKYGYKLVIDVQDIWPEAISGPIPLFSNTIAQKILAPITKYANETYSLADGLVAVSKTYLKRSDVKNLDDNLKKVVYIGADSLHFENYEKEKKAQKIIATYIGTMAGSYDLQTVVKAAALCHEYIDIQFIGTGPHEKNLVDLNRECGGYVRFLGIKSYKEAMKLLVSSDIAINPIKESAQQSITNKLSDYFCCGLPIISCQQSEEVKELLALGGGVQYCANNAADLAKQLIRLSQDRETLEKMSLVNQNIAKERFLRDISYNEISHLVDKLILSDK
ncbi:glycosyltransferase [Acinetobacter indicus]|uniref:glycosyltransferase n=1 Tax=Acinetobacter indicus TaxID=756892 RepID=UPI0014442246